MAKEKKAAPSKEELVRQLEEVAQYMEILGENDFKVRAYRKGADAVHASDAALDEIAEGKIKVPGVGEGLKGAIKEFLAGGQVKALSELAAKIPAGVTELMQVPGLGPKKAILIVEELGITTVGELEYACRENRLLTLKGFGESIQKKILDSIEAMHANAGKVRIDEALEHLEPVEEALRKKLGDDSAVVRVGAVGRWSEIVETIELLVYAPEKKAAAAIKAIKWDGESAKSTEEVLGSKFTVHSGQLRGGIRTLIWASADAPSDDQMRWLCAAPEAREKIEAKPKAFAEYEFSWLEAEWLGTGRKPAKDTYRLRNDGGVKGIFHCHTEASDGRATLEEMVRAAEDAGYEYIGISDHSQSAFYAQGLKPDRIRAQRKAIEALQKKTSIRIFHGVESDILQDGALDYDRDLLEGFDFIVGSIHSRFKMDEKAMTERIVTALENPFITIWGHPTGRLLLARKGYGLDWDRCLKAAVDNQVAVEINANPHRLDVDWRMGPQLEKCGVTVCINPDAHEVEGIRDTHYGEMMAEKAMLPKASILNLMGVNEMEKYLWQRKQRALRKRA